MSLAGIRAREHESVWVRQICGANLDARSAVPNEVRDEGLSPAPSNPSLSARFHCESLDEALRDQLAVTPAGFEPSKMKRAWVRQICGANLDARSAVPSASEGRAAVSSREQSLSPLGTATAQRSANRFGDRREDSNPRTYKSRVRQLCGAKLDAPRK